MAKQYIVVEFAGYEGEQDVGLFPTLTKAHEFIQANYQPDEVDEMHVCVARLSKDGRSYEF
jgi:nicotinic acid phosphoribosyltransferase